MTKTTLNIPRISCQHCVHTIEMELNDLPGILEVKADAGAKTAEITFQDPATEEKILELLAEINYPVQ